MDKALPFLTQLRQGNDDRFAVAGVKFISDGSIQNFTADLAAPPYYNGAPRHDNRHRMEHVQMLTAEQIATMVDYGISANVFSKHVKYWGDVHRSITLGPDRSRPNGPGAIAHRRGSAHLAAL
ncbi:MAG: hypothetical protein WCP28_12345 [Actinomycetes bacterium]